MMPKVSCALILPILLLTACGGGGGGGAPSLLRTTITGTATPPVAPVSGIVLANATVLTPPNSTGTWQSITQGANYSFDTAAFNANRIVLVKTLDIQPVDTQNRTTTITTGAVEPSDNTLGQTMTISGSNNNIMEYWLGPQPPSTTSPRTLTLSDYGPGLASVNILGASGSIVLVAEYAVPNSVAVSPTGYTYQTFGAWGAINAQTGLASEFYFSTGAPTVVASLPNNGTATYTGYAIGSHVDAATREISDIRATMNATADFAARSVAFTTTNTTSLAINAAPGTLPTANFGLNMSGTLTYTAASNTFTGVVSTANTNLSGNATGRFYGPTTKAGFAPAEIGGTFAVMNTAGGAMQGAFGGN